MRVEMKQLPATNDLAAAIKSLPRARADIDARTVEVAGSHIPGRYRVTFIVRCNPLPEVEAWFWGIEGSERLDVPDHVLAAPDATPDLAVLTLAVVR
jgi:hypothetical protein